ncbi:MAG: ArsR/SmtB family transcription factor [Hyphomicrobiaceae bacterium]
MATRDAEALDRTLAALADPTRRAMVERLAKSGRMAISDLATPFAMSLPAVLKHVGVLTEAGLVSRVKVGRTVYCHLLSGPIRTALTWLRKYENYQVPAESAAAAPRATASSARRPGRQAAKSEARTKRPAPKAARKPAARPVGRPSQSKPKATPRRSKAVAPAPTATTSKRGAGALTSAVRRRPSKVAAVRRPRR